MTPATTDLSDEHGDAVRHCDPVFRDYGGKVAFHGTIATISTFEYNSLVREIVEQPGEDRVLVVDGGGSLRCALFGGRDVAVTFAGVAFRPGEWLYADKDGIIVAADKL